RAAPCAGAAPHAALLALERHGAVGDAHRHPPGVRRPHRELGAVAVQQRPEPRPPRRPLWGAVRGGGGGVFPPPGGSGAQAGTNQTVASGGTVTVAEAGWPSQAICSASISPRL